MRLLDGLRLEIKCFFVEIVDLCAALMSTGGSTTGLMITDAAVADARSTYDVDVIAEIASYSEYRALGKRLRSLGFQEDTSEGAPLCRWQHQPGITRFGRLHHGR